MRIAIHQPHYLPWLGYLDKMAKVDKFVLLDDVQLTDKSNMFRNKFLSKSGNEKYLTVCFVKKEYMKKKYKEVELNKIINWQKDHINFIKDNYRKSNYFNEVFEYIKPLFNKEYEYLCDVAIDSLLLLKEIFQIQTEIILQSNLRYDMKSKKNDLVLDICKSMKVDEYLSGNGAKKYMDLDSFKENNINVEYQQFSHPIYSQLNSDNFVSNLSALDILFNCGIEKSREIFWSNVQSVKEFGEENNYD